MKPYIAAYKAGASAPTVDTDQLVYWFRPTPKDVACSNDPIGSPIGRDLLSDLIFVTTLLTDAATLTVTSGGQDPVTTSVEAGVHTFNFTMGVGTQQFAVSRGGSQILGGTSDKEISDSCEAFNFNAWVGSF